MKRLLAIIFAAACFAIAPATRAQDVTAALARAPASAETWAIISTAGRHGTSQRWTADGVRWSRESILLRGFVTEIDQQMSVGADGAVQSLTIRGVTPSGDAGETFTAANGRYQFRSPVDTGEAALPAGAFYSAFGGTIDSTIAFVDYLRSRPDHTMQLLPSGRAEIVQIATRTVTNGGQSKNLTAYAIVGVGLSPFPVWYEGDRFFAFAGFLSWIPEGWEGVANELSAAQDEALSGRATALVNEIGPRATAPIYFQNVRIYDAEARRFRNNRNVVVTDGRISAVGGRNVRAPENAQVIPGAGRTLVPGLWDSHQHFSGDDSGPLLLSQGITNIRDPGNRDVELIARRARINSGQLLGPRIIASLLIDGEGPNTAQMASVARNAEEGVAAVRHAHEAGYFGVKLYGTLDSSLVAPIAAEAHRLGLHVQGHIPHGMRPLEAVRAGYNEITHINFVMMQAMPDEVVQNSNGLPRFYGTARYAPDVNLRSPEMRAYLDELASRHIAVDPTLVTFEGGYVPNMGEIAAAYAPFMGTMPPAVERGFRAASFGPSAEVSREQMRRAQAALQNLVGELHRRRITIVAGTDGSGLELVRELELYVAAGFTPADALAAATIVPAQLFGVGEETGSIRVGKAADLALVEGDPSRNIGDLRNVVMVMRDGRLMQADALRRAIGISGPPRRAN
ncbi:MAG: amidohydrolase family protein [Hyphomonadaceae bacterium]|nr:amidohydrolase family protein [Hyphomonadaceae bacterium]